MSVMSLIIMSTDHHVFLKVIALNSYVKSLIKLQQFKFKFFHKVNNPCPRPYRFGLVNFQPNHSPNCRLIACLESSSKVLLLALGLTASGSGVFNQASLSLIYSDGCVFCLDSAQHRIELRFMLEISHKM